MTDAELVAKKLAEIEAYVQELRRLGRPDKIETDLREQRFVLHTLQIAIQSVIDVASHVVSDERLGEPETYQELFLLLARHGWIPEDFAEPLAAMARFRNVLVHDYARVDLEIVKQVVEEELGDLLVFAEKIREAMAG